MTHADMAKLGITNYIVTVDLEDNTMSVTLLTRTKDEHIALHSEPFYGIISHSQAIEFTVLKYKNNMEVK